MIITRLNYNVYVSDYRLYPYFSLSFFMLVIHLDTEIFLMQWWANFFLRLLAVRQIRKWQQYSNLNWLPLFKGFQTIVVKTSISIYFSIIFVLVNTLELAAVKTALLVCEQLGLQYMFLIPAMAISASAVFAERFMPETHGLKLEEIRNIFLENSEKVIWRFYKNDIIWVIKYIIGVWLRFNTRSNKLSFRTKKNVTSF